MSADDQLDGELLLPPEKFFVHYNRVNGELLDWCPVFVYCEEHHESKLKEFQHIRGHCKRLNCEAVERPPDTCLHCDIREEKSE